MIILFTELFDILPEITKRNINFFTWILYLLYKLPFVSFLVAPVGVLLGTISCFSLLLRYGEITAMKASGVTSYRIISPVLIVAFFISIISMVCNETIIPIANSNAKYIKYSKIYGKNIQQKKNYNISFRTGKNMFVNIKITYNNCKIMEGIEIKEYHADKNISTRIDAKYAKWVNNQWWLFDGVIRKFAVDKQLIVEQSFTKKKMNIIETPEDIYTIIIAKEKETENMNMRELKQYIQLLRRCGNRFEDKLVEFYLKTSFPFANFLMSLLGASISLWYPKGNITASFGISIIISFIYWEIIGIGRALGHAGILSPFLAAWLPNIIFGIIGIFFLKEIKR
jgi:lipopolysaccharide export system permease protein